MEFRIGQTRLIRSHESIVEPKMTLGYEVMRRCRTGSYSPIFHISLDTWLFRRLNIFADMRIPPLAGNSSTSRRHFLRGATSASIGALTLSLPAHAQTTPKALPAAFSALKPLGSRVRPIAAAEFGERLQHAQQLMSDAQSTPT